MEHEAAVRLGGFAGVFAAVALAEWIVARRPQSISRLRRWPVNLGLMTLNTLLLRLIFPVASVGMAMLAAERGWGLFQATAWPRGVEIVLAVILLDFAIYWQHVMFHAVPMLWRLHRVHHADPEVDVTTGVRFHTLEIILSMGLKLGIVVLLGASPLGVLVFEILLNATAMFNHGNFKIPLAVDRWLRCLVVTPDMHRVHHSTRTAETNSNYGFNLPWWDRWFKTYRAQPEDGHEGMTLGLSEFPRSEPQGLLTLLALPFRKRAAPDP